MMHLVYPDTFEGIVDLKLKERIVEEFKRYVTVPPGNVDRALEQIRRSLEAERNGKDFDFYDPDVWRRWNPVKAWDEYVEQAKAFIDTGKLDSEEVDYKVNIGQRLATAREAVLPEADNWGQLVKRGIAET